MKDLNMTSLEITGIGFTTEPELLMAGTAVYMSVFTPNAHDGQSERHGLLLKKVGGVSYTRKCKIKIC